MRRPLDFLGRIKVKLGLVIVLAVITAFGVNEVGRGLDLPGNLRVAIAVVLAVIMVQILAWGMTKPLREMAAAAQTIAKGRYGLRVSATSRDEVGELARAFNAMAADLGEVDRQRRELVANVSHELRTPITGLQAVLENVVDGVSPPDPETLGTALAQTQRLGRLVAQLLDLSRLESGARTIEAETFELGSLCDQAVREAGLARDTVTVLSRVPSGLYLTGDQALLAQVLANLLDNAVRHSPSGGSVILSAQPVGSHLHLTVDDDGPGIPPAERSRVFERFSRLDTARATDAGGAGLGLAITKEIVELHHGTIHIPDHPKGCRILVQLPTRPPLSNKPTELPPARPHPASTPRDKELDHAPANEVPFAPEPPQTVGSAKDSASPVMTPAVSLGSSEPLGGDLPLVLQPGLDGPLAGGRGRALWELAAGGDRRVGGGENHVDHDPARRGAGAAQSRAGAALPGGDAAVFSAEADLPGRDAAVSSAGAALPGGDAAVLRARADLSGGDAAVSSAEAGLPGVDAAVFSAGVGLPGRDAAVLRAEAGLPGGDAAVFSAEAGLPGRDAAVSGAGSGLPGPDAAVLRAEAGLPGVDVGLSGVEAALLGGAGADRRTSTVSGRESHGKHDPAHVGEEATLPGGAGSDRRSTTLSGRESHGNRDLAHGGEGAVLPGGAGSDRRPHEKDFDDNLVQVTENYKY
uniref:ATP-binding protein n=1 Tax=Acrocarpospora catenulata TaxID=2836182 RepID=UPI001BDA6E01